VKNRISTSVGWGHSGLKVVLFAHFEVRSEFRFDLPFD
jgi:hypothetical protein